MKRIFFSLFVMLGCTSQPSAPLSKANSVEIFVLDPMPEQAIQPKLNFHGFRILEQKSIDASIGKTFDALLQKGMDDNTGYLAACFNPRHGVRATINGSDYDFVVSFACNQMKAYSRGRDQTYLISDSAEAEFDKIFLAEGVGKTLSKELPKAGGTVNPTSQETQPPTLPSPKR